MEFISATQVVRAFENGEIDAAMLTLDEALRLEATTHDVALVVEVDVSDGADGLVARASVPDLATLRGARVGVERAAVGAFLLTRALQRAGLGTADVSVVPLHLNEHEAAWDTGTVDAVATFSPVLERLVARGGHLLFSSAELPGEIVDVLVIRASRAKQTPGLVALLRSQWFAARTWSQDHPEAFAQLAAARLRVPAGEVARMRAKLRWPDEQQSDAALDGGLLEVGRTLAAVLRDHQLAAVSDADALALCGKVAP